MVNSPLSISGLLEMQARGSVQDVGCALDSSGRYLPLDSPLPTHSRGYRLQLDQMGNIPSQLHGLLKYPELV